MPLVEVAHPLIAHHLARLRSQQTPPEEFRHLVARLAVLLAYEATQDLQLADVAVQTPLVEAAGKRLTQRIGLIPILRAGLGMVDPILNLIPSAEVWHLGLYRDEATAQPVRYYSKLPPQISGDQPTPSPSPPPTGNGGYLPGLPNTGAGGLNERAATPEAPRPARQPAGWLWLFVVPALLIAPLAVRIHRRSARE